MSNWTNELEICWNKLKCNFFKNHSHLDSKMQKSSTHTTLYFYHVYVSTKVGIGVNLKLMNWCQTEQMNLKYVEINWNVIFFKNHSHLDSKMQKSSTHTTLYFLSCLKGIKVGHLSRDATRQSRQLCVMADKWVAAPQTPQQLTYAAGGTSILVHSGWRANKIIMDLLPIMLIIIKLSGFWVHSNKIMTFILNYGCVYHKPPTLWFYEKKFLSCYFY